MNIHAADRVRKHIMLSIRKHDLSVLNVQKIIYINCSHCTIKRNCKKIAPWQTPMFFVFFFVFFFFSLEYHKEKLKEN